MYAIPSDTRIERAAIAFATQTAGSWFERIERIDSQAYHWLDLLIFGADLLSPEEEDRRMSAYQSGKDTLEYVRAARIFRGAFIGFAYRSGHINRDQLNRLLDRSHLVGFFS